MKTSIISPSQLALVIEIAVSAQSSGKWVPLASNRDEVESVLASACHGPATLDEYLTQLAEAKSTRGLRCDDSVIADIPFESILGDGLNVLSDEQLLRVAISPETIRRLNALVGKALETGTLSEYWWKAHKVPDSAIPPGYLDDEAMKRAMSEFRDFQKEIQETDVATTSPVSSGAKQKRTLRYAAALFALAASVLVGVAIGWYVRGNGQSTHQVLVASAVIEPAKIRGPKGEELKQVRITGPFDGFVTVIALAPDRKQRVFPEFGSDDQLVTKGAQSEGIPLPLDTTHVLFVVTETPAGESIRRAFEGKNARRYSPDKEDDLRRDLQEILTKKGYRRIAFGSSPIERQP